MKFFTVVLGACAFACATASSLAPPPRAHELAMRDAIAAALNISASYGEACNPCAVRTQG